MVPARLPTRPWGFALVALVALGACRKEATPTPTAASASAAVVAPSASAMVGSATGPVSSAAAPALASAAVDPVVRTRGVVGKYLPSACAEGRIYVDVKGLVALGGTKGAGVPGQLAGTLDKSGQAAKALAELSAAGLDLARDVREIGLCVRSNEDMVFAVDLDLSRVKGDVLDLIVKAASLSGGKFKKQRAGERDYVSLEGESGALARVAPSILVGAKDLKGLELAAKGSGAPLAEATTHVAYLEVAQTKTDRVRITVKDAGETVVVAGSTTLSGPAGAAIAKDPKAGVAQTRQLVAGVAQRLEKGLFAFLAEDLRKAELSADAGVITARVTLPRAHVHQLFAALGSAKPEDFAGLMK